MLVRSVRDVFPSFDPEEAETIRVHRARHVQALQLVNAPALPRRPVETRRIWAAGPEIDANLPATNDAAVLRGRAAANAALERTGAPR